MLPWWEGADEAQYRCSFSNLIRYGIGSQFDQHISDTDKFVWNARMKNYRVKNVIDSSILARQLEENRISVVLWKRPSGGRVEREENAHLYRPTWSTTSQA